LQIEATPTFDAIASFEKHFDDGGHWSHHVYEELANQLLNEQRWAPWVVQESGGALSAYRKCASELLGKDSHFAKQMRRMRSETVVGIMTSLLLRVKLYQ
jgi:hypothetical protein